MVPKQPETRAMTVRVKREDHLFLKELAGSRGVSVSTVVAEAVSEFARVVRRREAMRHINDLRARIQQAFGVGTSAVELINEARDERAEQLDSASRRHQPDL